MPPIKEYPQTELELLLEQVDRSLEHLLERYKHPRLLLNEAVTVLRNRPILKRPVAYCAYHLAIRIVDKPLEDPSSVTEIGTLRLLIEADNGAPIPENVLDLSNEQRVLNQINAFVQNYCDKKD